jgi:thiamine monophosphate synthase
MALGVEGIALSGSVLRADDPKSEMQQVVQTVRQARAERDTKQDFQEQHK